MRRFIIYLLAAVALCSAACTEKEETLPASAVEADKRGREDAKALCAANYTVERDLHAALLAVKSREWKLRQQGDTVAAGAYMAGFRNQLTETDRALADKIF